MIFQTNYQNFPTKFIGCEIKFIFGDIKAVSLENELLKRISSSLTDAAMLFKRMHLLHSLPLGLMLFYLHHNLILFAPFTLTPLLRQTLSNPHFEPLALMLILKFFRGPRGGKGECRRRGCLDHHRHYPTGRSCCCAGGTP